MTQTMTAERVAEALRTATAQRRPIDRITLRHPDFDLAAGYEAQTINRRLGEADGQRVIGAKLGLTSPAKQQTMGISEPIAGWLTQTAHLSADRALDLDQFFQPRLEPEIGFITRKDIDRPLTTAEAFATVDGIFLGAEIIDSRYTNYDFRLADVVADNCSAAAYLTAPTVRAPRTFDDLTLLGCAFYVDGALFETAASAAILGNPINAIVWLSQHLYTNGHTLAAGSIILAGAPTNAHPLHEVRSATVAIGGLGSITVRTHRP